MLHSPVLHIEAAPTDSRFRSQFDPQRAIGIQDRTDVVVHWVGAASRERLGQPLAVALAQMVTCGGELDAICAIDSALARELCTSEEIRRHLSSRGGAVLDRCDGRAESGVESIFRVRALGEGFVFRIQVPFPGSRVDFLFGDRLIVEVDGSEHHAGAEAFKRDRERDAWHAALGYLVMRFTYEQVIHRWTEVNSVLRLLIQRGEHLDPRLRIRRFV
jgi:very-short-patch-repair endonuclease